MEAARPSETSEKPTLKHRKIPSATTIQTTATVDSFLWWNLI
jgi:hypothetical protein